MMYWLLGFHVGVSTTMDLESWNKVLGVHRKHNFDHGILSQAAVFDQCNTTGPFQGNLCTHGQLVWA